MTPDWVDKCVARARLAHATIPEGMEEHVRSMLSGIANEKQMTTAELRSAAASLLAAMVSKAPRINDAN